MDIGEYPDNSSANASAQWWSKLLIHHNAAKQVYDNYKAVIQCLYNKFQEANHEDYLTELNDPDIGLLNIQPSIIYQHIVDWYAKIDLKMAQEIQRTFNEPMDPTKPLAMY